MVWYLDFVIVIVDSNRATPSHTEEFYDTEEHLDEKYIIFH
jgi:hypothetical protein